MKAQHGWVAMWPTTRTQFLDTAASGSRADPADYHSDKVITKVMLAHHGEAIWYQWWKAGQLLYQRCGGFDVPNLERVLPAGAAICRMVETWEEEALVVIR